MVVVEDAEKVANISNVRILSTADFEYVRFLSTSVFESHSFKYMNSPYL